MNKQPDSIGFLLGDVQRLMRRQFQQQLEGSGLTLAQARALVHIARSEGIRQVELADGLDIQPITLARQLDQLAENGLVERRSDPTDRRAYQLYLTEAATPYLALIKRASEVVHQRAIGELGEEATTALCHSLKILRANLCHS
ncbi:MarR family transcriptional regulator [Aeromonas encheleia]|jgi:DNA-binding MarR family transcriptional regulator|uniref:MarR family transcriptional regulator n=1 Tax=Aeromonas encheleia TaxID=73010 RepID=A0AAE9MGJ2_9GAMM|nr:MULTISPECIES: MarR family transcriptional regulator [Aeromonas]MBV7415951.1 MarR family transcriptional regulator [Aeromonas sp. sif2433]MBV7438209.1 MarR family transcriptional regulator [Aeromonas sp. sif2416]MBV7597416.1 MarR family transcriptional regulator [Aeromonas sp. sia0103]UNP89203.1 MarR family transcriptional regulator [Aeromonas encheleia]USV56848.1 MarR family transcriptional regulator [Aeromonas encheleia]